MRYFELCEKSVGFAEEIMNSFEFKEMLKIKEEISLKIPNLLEEFTKYLEQVTTAMKDMLKSCL